MEISPALILSLVGVLLAMLSTVIAFFAFKHSVKTAREASWHQEIHSKKVLADANERHLKVLNEVIDDFAPIIDELSTVAAKSHSGLAQIFEQFDNKKSDNIHLRHAFHDITESTRDAFDRILTYQPGLHLVGRFRNLKDIEREDALSDNQFANMFSQLFHQQPHFSPEKKLFTSTRFKQGVRQLYSRISAANEPELFQQCLVHIYTYSEKHEEMKGCLVDLSTKLEKCRLENLREPFKIKEVPSLGIWYKKMKGDIARIKELTFPDLSGLKNFPIQDGIAYTIYAGSVLEIVAHYDLWGYTSPDWTVDERKLSPTVY